MSPRLEKNSQTNKQKKKSINQPKKGTLPPSHATFPQMPLVRSDELSNLKRRKRKSPLLPWARPLVLGVGGGDTVKCDFFFLCPPVAPCPWGKCPQHRAEPPRAFSVPAGLRQHTTLHRFPVPSLPPSNGSEFRNTFQIDTSVIYVRYSALGWMCLSHMQGRFLLAVRRARAACRNLSVALHLAGPVKEKPCRFGEYSSF